MHKIIIISKKIFLMNISKSSEQYFEKLFKEECIYEESRSYHLGSSEDERGKFEVVSKKPVLTQGDLALAYSPGVGAPSFDIYQNPDKIYDYTSKGNIVAVVSNGTAVLGLGNIGPEASLPVMEGKSVLFKKFADIDSIPIIVKTSEVDEFVNSVALISSGWAGINLEDIAAPECFEIERKLQEKLDIPVFHDDQHGTAIVAGAALLNAIEITGQEISKMKMVMSGAGAAGIACLRFFISLGLKKENVIICDRDGVVFEGRTNNMDSIKAEFAAKTDSRTLAEAIKGANIFIGLSAAGVLKEEMLLDMAPNPIIFAMANPEPEIKPEIAKRVRPDSIIATGRSDYPNQVNNVMGFPYIFRGALDVRATKINEEMKIAAAKAIALLAKEPVHDNVFVAYSGRSFKYGPEYIIPTPFDPRLLEFVTSAVARAAIETGVARLPIKNFDEYTSKLNSKLDPTINLFELLHEKVIHRPKTILFAEGEEIKVIRAASNWVSGGYGKVILVGDQKTIQENMNLVGVQASEKIQIINSALCKEEELNQFIEYYYSKMCRKGILKRDAARAVKIDRNVFSACLLAFKKADGMITGLTRNYHEALSDVTKAVDHDDFIFGVSGIMTKNHQTIFISDSVVNYKPNVEELVKITIKTAAIAKEIGYTPRAALVSYASFGDSSGLESCGIRSKLKGSRDSEIREAVSILHSRKDVDFEVDGELSADVALNKNLLAEYSFSKLKSPANILIMPGIYSADIAQKMLKSLTDAILVGPILIGLKAPVQIVSMNSSVSEIMNMAVLTVSGLIR